MNKLQGLFAGFAAAIGIGGIAAYNGAFSPAQPPVQPPAQLAAQPSTAETPAKTEAPASTETPAVASAEAAKPAPAEPAPQAAQTPEAIAPTFDVLRVEPSGSVLIAGKAEPQSEVEVLNGNEVVGKAKAEINGDFAIVLDIPLKPGDYQLVLRATGTGGSSANSVETATVSVPDQPNGEVLALVEAAGKPSRIITAPQAAEAKVAVTAEVPANAAVEQPQQDTQAAQAAAPDAAAPETAAPADAQTAVPAPEPAKPADPATDVPAAQTVTVEAVEVEGNRIFIAGNAGGAKTVRVYANDQLLGDAKPGEGDRFLLDIQKELAPGDYIIRAEGLGADGVTMLSRTSVPFKNGDADVAVSGDAATPAPAAAGEVANAPAEAPKKNVIIRRGDTLWQISRRIYGRGVRYSTIYLANKDVTANPNRIFPGQVFAIPEKTPEGDAADPQEIEKRAEPN